MVTRCCSHHLQRAQPILFGHHLLAYFKCLSVTSRFMDCFERADESPLFRRLPVRPSRSTAIHSDRTCQWSRNSSMARIVILRWESVHADDGHSSALEELVLWSSHGSLKSRCFRNRLEYHASKRILTFRSLSEVNLAMFGSALTP